jgi:hypothetical protein
MVRGRPGAAGQLARTAPRRGATRTAGGCRLGGRGARAWQKETLTASTCCMPLAARTTSSSSCLPQHGRNTSHAGRARLDRAGTSPATRRSAAPTLAAIVSISSSVSLTTPRERSTEIRTQPWTRIRHTRNARLARPSRVSSCIIGRPLCCQRSHSPITGYGRPVSDQPFPWSTSRFAQDRGSVQLRVHPQLRYSNSCPLHGDVRVLRHFILEYP